MLKFIDLDAKFDAYGFRKKARPTCYRPGCQLRANLYTARCRVQAEPEEA